MDKRMYSNVSVNRGHKATRIPLSSSHISFPPLSSSFLLLPPLSTYSVITPCLSYFPPIYLLPSMDNYDWNNNNDSNYNWVKFEKCGENCNSDNIRSFESGLAWERENVLRVEGWEGWEQYKGRGYPSLWREMIGIVSVMEFLIVLIAIHCMTLKRTHGMFVPTPSQGSW